MGTIPAEIMTSVVLLWQTSLVVDVMIEVGLKLKSVSWIETKINNHFFLIVKGPLLLTYTSFGWWLSHWQLCPILICIFYKGNIVDGLQILLLNLDVN